MSKIFLLRFSIILICLFSITFILIRKFKDDVKKEKSANFFKKYNVIDKDKYQKCYSNFNADVEKKILDAKNNAKKIEYQFDLEEII